MSKTPKSSFNKNRRSSINNTETIQKRCFNDFVSTRVVLVESKKKREDSVVRRRSLRKPKVLGLGFGTPDVRMEEVDILEPWNMKKRRKGGEVALVYWRKGHEGFQAFGFISSMSEKSHEDFVWFVFGGMLFQGVGEMSLVDSVGKMF